MPHFGQRPFIQYIAFAMVALVAASAFAKELDWRFPTDKISLEQWTQFRDEVLSKPNIERAEFGEQLVITVMAESAIYIFTQPKHPAYPAVVVRFVVEHGSGSAIKRMGHFAGSEPAFAAWWKQFDALDALFPRQSEESAKRK